MDYLPLCEAWPVSGCASLDEFNPAVTGVGALAASEVLWAASGYRFGTCEVTFRPCSRRCLDQPYGGWWWTADAFTGWPAGPAHGGWVAAACGHCRGSCACNDAAELRLPAPVQGVSQVLVDGVPLVEGDNWLLYDGTTLVRTDGERWPFCQDWTVTGGPGTFLITATFGEPVPALGALAMGEVLPEVLRACAGDGDCKLPAGTVQEVTRQGVRKVFVDRELVREARWVGLPVADRFIEAFNPGGLIEGIQIWDPEEVLERRARRLGGAP